MEQIPLEKLLDRTGGSVYKLVVLASQRALAIAEGQAKLVEADSSLKPSAVALKEILESKVRYKNKAA